MRLTDTPEPGPPATPAGPATPAAPAASAASVASAPVESPKGSVTLSAQETWRSAKDGVLLIGRMGDGGCG